MVTRSCSCGVRSRRRAEHDSQRGGRISGEGDSRACTRQMRASCVRDRNREAAFVIAHTRHVRARARARIDRYCRIGQRRTPALDRSSRATVAVGHNSVERLHESRLCMHTEACGASVHCRRHHTRGGMHDAHVDLQNGPDTFGTHGKVCKRGCDCRDMSMQGVVLCFVNGRLR